MNSHPNKVVVLVETLFIPEELKNYREVFEANGFQFELAARLWNQPKLTFYSDNISDTAMEGPKPLETIEVTTDASWQRTFRPAMYSGSTWRIMAAYSAPKRGSSGKFRQREGKPVGRKDEEPSLSWIWNQRLPVSSDEV
jgi:hypothetical protein